MTKEIAEDINAYAPVDGPYGEGMPGNMSGQTDIEIQFFSYPVGYFGHIYLIVGEQPGSLFHPHLRIRTLGGSRPNSLSLRLRCTRLIPTSAQRAALAGTKVSWPSSSWDC